MKNLPLQIITGRWFTFFASLLIMSFAGATYIFGLYSNDIKTSLGYDQTTLNTLSFFKDLGGNLGLISGLINEITPPWTVLAVGASLNFVGYFMIWLSVTGKVTKPPLWLMCTYIATGANSQSFANTGALVTSVRNFPDSRGCVLGLLKGFVGLSGAILAQLYHAFYGEESKSLILLIAWLPSVVSFVFLGTVRVVNGGSRSSSEIRVLYRVLFISLFLAGFLMLLIIFQSQIVFSRSEFIGCGTIVIVLLLLPLLVFASEEFKISKKNSTLHLNRIDQVPPIDPPPPSETLESQLDSQSDGCFEKIFNPPARGKNYTILQALFSIDMWILFIAVICGVGGTLTAIDNLGQIGNSLNYPKRSVSTFVSLVSIWNYLGRVVAGFGSEILLKKHGIPRPILLTFFLFLSSVGHLLIAFAVPHSLYFASIIIGFCFGAQWPLLFAIVSEIFGLKYYSTLYNLSGVASPVGAYILNVRVAGFLYDKEAKKQMKELGLRRGAGEELNCSGEACYKMAFIMIAGATLFGCLVSVLLVIRTRSFYKSYIDGKFTEEEEEEAADEKKMVEVNTSN